MWSWSHSQEAYSNARDNLSKQERDWLETVYAEWVVRRHHTEDENDWNSGEYYKAIKHAKTLADDVIIDYIWDAMEEQAECSNGGHDAYACPYQCHSVSFGKDT